MDQHIIEKHLKFWRGENVEPLCAELPHPGWSRKPYPLSRNRYAIEPQRIEPDDIDIDKLLAADRLPTVPNTGEYLHGVKTMYPVACMESVIGCPIFAADTSCYSRPYDSLPSTEPKPSSAEWVPILDSVIRREVELSSGRLPSLQLHLRGIVDMVAAYWGEERMCLSMFDDPKAIHTLVADFASLYLDMARRGVEARPKWHDGFVSHWGVFAPEALLDYQVDATSILSKAQYDEFFLSVDEDILSAFPFSVVHLHACGLHIAPSIAGCARVTSNEKAFTGGRAVEISLDREAGAFQIEAIIDATRLLQMHGVRVILNGELYEAEVEILTQALDPGGLAIFSWRPRPTT